MKYSLVINIHILYILLTSPKKPKQQKASTGATGPRGQAQLLFSQPRPSRPRPATRLHATSGDPASIGIVEPLVWLGAWRMAHGGDGGDGVRHGRCFPSHILS